MPLVKGQKARTRKGFAENVRRERKEGKKLDQSVAIAYSEAGKAKKKARKHADEKEDKKLIKKMVKPKAMKKY